MIFSDLFTAAKWFGHWVLCCRCMAIVVLFLVLFWSNSCVCDIKVNRWSVHETSPIIWKDKQTKSINGVKFELVYVYVQKERVKRIKSTKRKYASVIENVDKWGLVLLYFFFHSFRMSVRGRLSSRFRS